MSIEFATEDLPADGLALLAHRAKEFKAAVKDVERVELDLAAAKNRQRELEEILIPEAMAAIGMKSFTLHTGESVTIEDEYHTSIPKAMESKAFAWLRETGNDSIIKRSIALVFGKGEDKRANKFLALFAKQPDLQFTDKQFVHPQTLKAFVKESIEAEKISTPEQPVKHPLPRELFGLHIINRATIKEPKK